MAASSLSLRDVVAGVDGSNEMRPGKWSRRLRRRAAIGAALVVAFGAAAVGAQAAGAVEIGWGFPAGVSSDAAGDNF